MSSNRYSAVVRFLSDKLSGSTFLRLEREKTFCLLFQEIPSFFRFSSNSDFLDRLLKNSSIFSLHYFHHMTMNLPIESNSPFDRLAQKFCPTVARKILLLEKVPKKNSPNLLLLFFFSLFFSWIFLVFLRSNFRWKKKSFSFFAVIFIFCQI